MQWVQWVQWVRLVLWWDELAPCLHPRTFNQSSVSRTWPGEWSGGVWRSLWDRLFTYHYYYYYYYYYYYSYYYYYYSYYYYYRVGMAAR